jgi:hypothetical protein
VTQLTAAALKNHHVVGTLGIPLGTVTEIRATIVSGDSKGYEDHYRLRVTEVASHPLTRPMTIEFCVPSFVSVNLARDHFELYEMKTDKKTGRLEDDQIAELEKGYVGKPVRLTVYETGGFFGIPANLPSDIIPWQDRLFGFSTQLTVLAER